MTFSLWVKWLTFLLTNCRRVADAYVSPFWFFFSVFFLNLTLDLFSSTTTWEHNLWLAVKSEVVQLAISIPLQSCRLYEVLIQNSCAARLPLLFSRRLSLWAIVSMIISRPPGQFPWCNAGVVLLEPTLIRTPNNRDLCSWWDSLCLCLSSLFPSTGVLEQHNLETHFFFFRRTTTQRADCASATFELTIIKKYPLLSLIMMSTWRRDPPWRPAGSPRTPAQTSAPAPDAWGSNECVAACISMTDDSALSRACIITLSFILVLNYWCLHSLCLL